MIALRKLLCISLILALLLVQFSYAHGVEEEHDEEAPAEGAAEIDISNLDEYYQNVSLVLVYVGGAIIFLFTVFCLIWEKKLEKHPRWKKPLFTAIVVPIVIVTLWIAGSTIYVNILSTSEGAVHWHADFEVYKCGKKIHLESPEGLLNRIGSSKFHEHGDLRIHVEGKVMKLSEVSLGNFFHVIGGHLEPESFEISTDDGIVTARNGEKCNGEEGKVQVFLYKVLNPDPTRKRGFVYRQIKLENPEDYVVSSFFNVPPGDCVIVEFAPDKKRTDNICASYKLSESRGDIIGS